MSKLSVVLATFNEEDNIGKCLQSVKQIADEICIVDGQSSDKTVEVAKEMGAKVLITENKSNFHINKQKAIDMATGDWILLLDADERVSKKLAEEITTDIALDKQQIVSYQQSLKKRNLFLRHQQILATRDGRIGTDDGDYVAFFLPRKNYFLGRYLMHGGVYPDGVIRLFKKGKAYLPAKDVHEQIVVQGKVGWLDHDLLHYDSPTFSKYIMRWNRYTNLIAQDIKNSHQTLITPFTYLIFRPIWWFLLTFIRHKGFLDSWQGFLFSFFSALRFPRAYLVYREKKYNGEKK